MASLEYTGQIKRVSLTLEDLSSWNGVTPDPDDRHILAAAFKADVDNIISTDVKHLLNGSVQQNIHHRWFELKMEKPNNESTPLVLSPKHFFKQYPNYRS
jgi:predicted nucleic acid-binding protein